MIVQPARLQESNSRHVSDKEHHYCPVAASVRSSKYEGLALGTKLGLEVRNRTLILFDSARKPEPMGIGFIQWPGPSKIALVSSQILRR